MHYGVKQEQSLLSPSHPLTTHNANSQQQQQQHFSNHQQHSTMLYHNNTSGVQSNQYCYDSRTPVSLYSSGDAQELRPQGNSSNTASHQMLGGKSRDLFMSCDHRYISTIFIISPLTTSFSLLKWKKLFILHYHKLAHDHQCTNQARFKAFVVVNWGFFCVSFVLVLTKI